MKRREWSCLEADDEFRLSGLKYAWKKTKDIINDKKMSPLQILKYIV